MFFESSLLRTACTIYSMGKWQLACKFQNLGYANIRFYLCSFIWWFILFAIWFQMWAQMCLVKNVLSMYLVLFMSGFWQMTGLIGLVWIFYFFGHFLCCFLEVRSWEIEDEINVLKIFWFMQVLPSRTHPCMQMSAFGGYILSGTKICNV